MHNDAARLRGAAAPATAPASYIDPQFEPPQFEVLHAVPGEQAPVGQSLRNFSHMSVCRSVVNLGSR